MKQLLTLGVFIIPFVSNLTTFGATIFWNGSGDGFSWSDANNWSNNVPPTPSDDVIINGLGTNITITVGNDVTVRSLQCSASLSVAGGSLNLRVGASQVAGSFTVASGLWLSASSSNTTFTANGPANIDGT